MSQRAEAIAHAAGHKVGAASTATASAEANLALACLLQLLLLLLQHNPRKRCMNTALAHAEQHRS